MNFLSEDINKKIRLAVEQNFESVIDEKIDRFIDFFNSLTELREGFPDYDEKTIIVNVENARKICESINILIDKHYQRNESLAFETLFPGLINELDSSISQLEPTVKLEQSEDRFKPLTTDKKDKQIAKRIKGITLKAYQSILKLVNPILIKVKKKPYKIKYWNQTVPLRNVGYYFLLNELLGELSLVYEDVSRKLSKSSISFWNYDGSYDDDFISNFVKGSDFVSVKDSVDNPEKIVAKLESLKDEVKKNSLTSIEKSTEAFYNACERVGTIELKKSKFSNDRIKKHFNNEKNEFNKIIKEWDNTLYALGEDWELNCDLELARYSAIKVYFEFEKSLSVKNRIQIQPQFKEISGALNFIIEKLEQPTPSIQELERMIAFSKETLEKILLSSTLPNLINSITDLKLLEMIDDAASEIKDQMDSITEVRAFVKTVTYDNKIKSSDIDNVHPREFVFFNALPKLSASFEGIKKDNIVELKNIQSELINLGNMADFGLESAISAVSTEKLSEADPREIALEGIKISRDRKEQLKNSYDESSIKALKNIRGSITDYIEELFSFSQSSKITEIKIQLAKAKAKAKANEAKDKLFLSVKNFIPVVFEKTIGYYKKGSRLYTDTRKQFGLTDSKESITSEISNFLSRANESVEKLPYIYRRLFQLSPLENDRLYSSRQVEESQLEMAYNNWLSGGYAPVIISSEKGAGITSFLNIFLKKLQSKNKIKRLSIKPSIYSQQDLLNVIGEKFSPEKFFNFDEVINFLNNEENKQVIVVENLQHMYLRSAKGFVCLKILTDIISKTSKNIFWITSSTVYADEFLNKSIRLNDIFGYHISLKDLESNQIIDLIKKRNSISGYNLEYEPDTRVPRKKDFEKLSYEQKQNLLEKEFFNLMNKFAQSNISLALIFWLRSIREIKERKVFINVNFEISSTILNYLTPEKVFVLQSLILHDGLSIPDLARTINYSFDETNQLTQILYDDGVLVKSNGVFLINPLLYRQSVTLLKSKNLI